MSGSIVEPTTASGPADDSPAAGIRLPDRPLLVIEPSHRWIPLNIQQIWAYRGLLYFLAWRDLKVRYKQTILGGAWAVIQPLTTMFVFTIFFGKLAKIPSEGLPYPIFAYAGLLPWTYFSNAVTKSANSLISEGRLISKVYFPRILVTMTPSLAGLVDFSISTAVYFLLMIWFRTPVEWEIVFLPLLAAMTGILAFSIGTLMSGWNVRYRDLRQVMGFGIQLMLFASPVIYPTTMIPEKWRWLLMLNPMTGIIEAFRTVLLPDRPLNVLALVIGIVMTIVLFLVAVFQFRRVERGLADII
ncbi:MAG TPA: ABC transporter permease [Thermoanaerobaculia bacterium]|nr:ABC transporter permease [Thermoanaerobaculia bacterium]